ncbi:MAG: hypothetical protein GY841_13650 [FCB group bacterium]|nr:hypothetical protein [FCB group bacterium]
MKDTFMKTALIIIGAVLLSGVAGAETVEGIAAVVGDRVILNSELANQVQMYLMSVDPNSEVDTEELARNVLTQMINDELILSAAREDTTIVVSEDEIRNRLNEHIASLASRFPTEAAFLEQLRQEGLTKRTLEKRYRPQIRDQLLKQKIINTKMYNVSISRQEVEDFYHRASDSLPELPGKVKLAHILFKFKVSESTDDSVRVIAEKARVRALDGGGFPDVAAEFETQFPGVVGGRLGFIRRDEVLPEFGRASFNLQPGAISGLVKTMYGWHIIKSHTRLTDSVDVSHILFPMAPSAVDSARAYTLADSLYQELLAGADFKETAKLHSDDDASRGVGGEREAMALDELRPEFVEPLAAVEIGQFTSPVQSQMGYHILKLLEREEKRSLDIDKDFDIIRNIARQEKTQKMVGDWVDEIKKKVYVDVRDIGLKK